MDAEHRTPVVRARQRSRSALPAFSVPLRPTIDEVGVDRMQIGVRGSWQLTHDGLPIDRISPDAFERAFQELAERQPWLRKPEVNKWGVVLRTKTRSKVRGGLTSLGSSRVFLSGVREGQGKIEVSITCNPTETLAHRLADAGGQSDFFTSLNSLTPFGFFARSGVRPSLDNSENWLPDLDLAQRLLGDDVFGAFFPIFATKLMHLVAHLVAPVGQLAVTEDGTDQVIERSNLVARLHWGTATAPQIETYFERHHAEARSTVRAAAQAMLASLDETRVRHHLRRVSFERQEDLFSIRSEVPADRDLSVYAKAPDRLRFEITRPKRGRYPAHLLFKPEDRLLQIFRGERNDLLDCCDWDAIACLFEEPSAPTVGDLVRLASTIAEVCASCGEPPQPTFEALLVDGGLRASLEEVPEAVVKQLQRAGVLERVSLRNRNRPGEQRYSLRPDYLWLMERLKSALATHISPSLAPDRSST